MFWHWDSSSSNFSFSKIEGLRICSSPDILVCNIFVFSSLNLFCAFGEFWVFCFCFHFLFLLEQCRKKSQNIFSSFNISPWHNQPTWLGMRFYSPSLCIMWFMHCVCVHVCVCARIHTFCVCSTSLSPSQKEVWDVWCLPSVWNLRTVIWFSHPFSLVFCLVLLLFLSCNFAEWSTIPASPSVICFFKWHYWRD